MHGVLENIVAKSAELIPFYCESSTKKKQQEEKTKNAQRMKQREKNSFVAF